MKMYMCERVCVCVYKLESSITQLLLSYQGLSMSSIQVLGCRFYLIESTLEWRKLMPPTLSTSHCVHASLMVPVRVPTLEKPSQSSCRSFSPVFCMHLIKGFLTSIIFLGAHHFFLFICFISSCTFTWAGVNPGSFSLFVHSLICPITHSFFDGFCSSLCGV